MNAIYEFEGYRVTSNGNAEKPVVEVFDPRTESPAIFRTTSLDRAIQWVKAYRLGSQWAVDSRL